MKKIFIAILSLITLTLLCLVGTGIWILCDNTLQTNITNSLLKDAKASVSKTDLSLSEINVENFKIDTGKGIFFVENLSFSYDILSLLLGELKGKGFIKNAVFTFNNETAPKVEKTKSLNSIRTNREISFTIPIKINISSFDGNIEIINGKQRAKTNTQIKNLKIFDSTILFQLNSQIETLSQCYLISAEKTDNIINAKISTPADDILLLSGTMKNFTEADIKAKLILTTKTLSPLTEILKLQLPKIDTEIYAQTKLNCVKNRYSADIVAKTNISNIQKLDAFTNVPFNKCDIQLQTNFSLDDKTISIEKMDCTLETDNHPTLRISRTQPLSADLTNLKSEQWLNLGEATVSIPAHFISAFLKNKTFSAEHIGGVFEISINNNASLRLKSIKPANILNAEYSDKSSTIFSGLTLLLEADAIASFKHNEYSLDTKISSQIVDNKHFCLSLKANKSKGHTTCKVEGNGSLTPILSRINSISATAINDMSITLDTQIELSEILKISNINASISSDEAKEVLSISTKAPIELDFAKEKFTSKEPIRVSIENFPWAPFRPFVPNADAKSFNLKTDIKLSDSKIDANGNFSMSDFSYNDNAQSLIKDISIYSEFRTQFDAKTKTLAFETPKMELSNGASTILTASVNTLVCVKDNPDIKNFEAHTNFQLPQIMAQPALVRFNNLLRASGQIDVKLDKTKKLTASASITNIASKTLSDDIESVNCQAVVELTKPLKLTANAEINSARATSKVSVNLTDSENISAAINAERIVVDDILILKDAFTNALFVSPKGDKKKKFRLPDEAKSSASFEELKRKDLKAFWDCSTNLSANVKVNELILSGKSTLKDFSANIALNNENIFLSKLNSKLLDGNLSGNVKISFNGDKPLPYYLEKSSIILENFKLEKLSSEEFLSGTYTAKASISGNGANLQHLMNYVVGNISILAKDGSIRLINEQTEVGQKISLAHSAAKLANQLLNNKDVDNSLKLVEMFEKINFNTATIALSRNDIDFNINIDSAEITSDNLLLKTQKGTIYFSPDRNILKQDMQIDISIYTNNKTMISMLSSVNAIATKSDLENYKQSETFKIFGTIEKPKTNLIEILSGKTTTSTATKLLNKLKLFK